MVDIFLSAFGVVARSQKSAGRIGSLARLQAGGLGVVVMTIRVVFGDVLEDDAPVTLDVDSALDFGISHLRGAEVALRPDPVGGVIGRGALGSSGVIIVIKSGFLISSDVLNQIVSRLVSHIRVLFQENGVLRDLVGHLVIGVFGVFKAVGKVGMKGAGWRGFGVTVAMGGWGIGSWVVGNWVMGSRMVGGGVRVGRGRKGQGDWDDHGSNKFENHGGATLCLKINK